MLFTLTILKNPENGIWCSNEQKKFEQKRFFRFAQW